MTDERECDQPQQLPNFWSSDPVWSDFKFIRPSGTEWRFFRRISDKVTCRCLSFWPTRRIQCPRESYEINRLPTIRGLASPSAKTPVQSFWTGVLAFEGWAENATKPGLTAGSARSGKFQSTRSAQRRDRSATKVNPSLFAKPIGSAQQLEARSPIQSPNGAPDDRLRWHGHGTLRRMDSSPIPFLLREKREEREV